jgi:hypothetical protein
LQAVSGDNICQLTLYGICYYKLINQVPRKQEIMMTNVNTVQKEFCPITAGSVMRGLIEWHNDNDKDFDRELQDDCPENWLAGGYWRMSQAIAEAVDSYDMFWDDGVFEYDHCMRGDQSIWEPTVLKMTKEEWYELSGNNCLPEWLEAFTHEVMAGLGIQKAEKDEPAVA